MMLGLWQQCFKQELFLMRPQPRDLVWCGIDSNVTIDKVCNISAIGQQLKEADTITYIS